MAWFLAVLISIAIFGAVLGGIYLLYWVADSENFDAVFIGTGIVLAVLVFAVSVIFIHETLLGG